MTLMGVGGSGGIGDLWIGAGLESGAELGLCLMVNEGRDAVLCLLGASPALSQYAHVWESQTESGEREREREREMGNKGGKAN